MGIMLGWRFFRSWCHFAGFWEYVSNGENILLLTLRRLVLKAVFAGNIGVLISGFLFPCTPM
jgi:hypothetical protein